MGEPAELAIIRFPQGLSRIPQYLPIQPTSLVQATPSILPPPIEPVPFIEPALSAQPLPTESTPLPVQPISSVFRSALPFRCAQLFADILSAIQELGREVEDGLVFVENIGRDFREQWKMACESEGASGGESGREGCG